MQISDRDDYGLKLSIFLNLFFKYVALPAQNFVFLEENIPQTKIYGGNRGRVIALSSLPTDTTVKLKARSERHNSA